MSILIAYASKYEATQQIAERVTERLAMAGQEAEARPIKAIDGVADYDAFVIGSAVYYGAWLKEAV